MRRFWLIAGLALLTLLRPLQAQGTRLNFVDARLVDVIRTLAAAQGLTTILGDIPERRVTLSSADDTGKGADLGGLLESLLEANGLILVRRGGIAQILPADKAPPTGELHVGKDLPSPAPVGLVTQLVPLQNLRAEEAILVVKQVATAFARVEPVPRSNSVLLTDRGVHVARYLELLRALDQRPEGEGGLQTYVVPLHHAAADELATTLGQLFGVPVAGVGGSSRPAFGAQGLSASLQSFREREADVYRLRAAIPPPTTGAVPQTDSAGTARARAQGLVGQTTIVPNRPTNSLIVRTAATNFPLLQQTIESLDVRPPQVLLEVLVAEVSLTRATDYGIDWSAVGSKVSGSFGDPLTTDSGASGLVVRAVSLNRVDVRAVLRALASSSRVRVISTPQILAQNNEPARILVGSKVPFVASTRSGLDVAIDRSVQYQDVGTSLSIVPRINEDGFVSVQLLQQVSSLSTQTVQAALNAPIIITREAETSAIVRHGQTVVIGGLIDSSDEVTESGVPLLKDLPLLGFLFKRHVTSKLRTELVIFVTPFVVRSDAEAVELRERTEERLNGLRPGELVSPLAPRP